MLTGDLNTASVEWTVQWKVTEPKDFLFRFPQDAFGLNSIAPNGPSLRANPRSSIRMMWCSAEGSLRQEPLPPELLDRYRLFMLSFAAF